MTRSVRINPNPYNLPCDGRGEEECEKNHLQLSCKYGRLRKSVEASGLPEDEDLEFCKMDIGPIFFKEISFFDFAELQ
jgi:hypothetical protein